MLFQVQHRRFSASTEKAVGDGNEQLSFLLNEAEVTADTEAAQDEKKAIVAAHKHHKKHEYTLDNLPEGVATEMVEHRVTHEALECLLCGETIHLSDHILSSATDYAELHPTRSSYQLTYSSSEIPAKPAI